VGGSVDPPTIPVGVIEPFRCLVVRLQILVVDRPGRRHPSVVPDLSEVCLSVIEERRAVEFRVAAT